MVFTIIGTGLQIPAPYEFSGTGEVQMITSREQGETVYFAVRTTAPAGSGRQGTTTSPRLGLLEP